jgi:hypothetical protein
MKTRMSRREPAGLYTVARKWTVARKPWRGALTPKDPQKRPSFLSAFLYQGVRAVQHYIFERLLGYMPGREELGGAVNDNIRDYLAKGIQVELDFSRRHHEPGPPPCHYQRPARPGVIQRTFSGHLVQRRRS